MRMGRWRHSPIQLTLTTSRQSRARLGHTYGTEIPLAHVVVGEIATLGKMGKTRESFISQLDVG